MIRALFITAAIAGPAHAETDEQNFDRVINICNALGDIAGEASASRLEGFTLEHVMAAMMAGVDPDHDLVPLMQAVINGAFMIPNAGTFRGGYLALAYRHKVAAECFMSFANKGKGA